MYFGFIRFFNANKFQLSYKWFFTGIETLWALEKKRFLALRKMLCPKKHFIPELKFIYRKTDKKKRPRKFPEAFMQFFYANWNLSGRNWSNFRVFQLFCGMNNREKPVDKLFAKF